MALKQLLTLAIVLVAQVASAESVSSLRGQLEQRYAVFKNAFQSKDEAAIRSLLADGFVDVDVSGKSHNAAEMMKGLVSIPDDPNREMQITILSVRGMATLPLLNNAPTPRPSSEVPMPQKSPRSFRHFPRTTG